MKEKIILNDVQREFYNKIINTPIEEFDFSSKVLFRFCKLSFLLFMILWIYQVNIYLILEVLGLKI